MAHTSLGPLLRHLAAPRPRDGRGDGELLRAHAAGDADAFGALVRRHGPRVLAVCRRVLGHEQNAEDAFQATFLVLARRAGSLRADGSLAGWLYGVACRVALHLKRTAARRRRHEAQAPPPVRPPEASPASLRELQAVLDEEVARLPEKYRAPFVLCCLEGHGKGEAARLLGWPEGTVSGRLARARALLQARLTRRGVALSAALAATAAAVPARAVPPALLRAAVAGRAGGRAEGLAAAMLHPGPVARLPLALAAAAAVAVAGTLLVARDAAPPPAPPLSAAAADAPSGPKPRVDRFGDELPDGASARLGTARLRHDFMIHSVHFAPDGKSVLAVAGASTARAVSRWDVTTGRELPAPRLLKNPIGVAYSADGRALLCTATKGLALRDALTGAEIRLFDGPHSLLAVAFSPDGTRVAAGGHEKSVHIWDAATGLEPMCVKDLPHSVWSVAFAPRGEPALAAAVLDGTVRCFDPATGAERWKQQAHAKSTIRLAYAPDGRTLASVAEDGEAVCMMDAATGKVLRRFHPEGERSGPESVCFSPDGKLLATGGRDGLVRLWDPNSGKEVRHWRESPYRVTSLAFSPDGRTLASCGGMNSAVGLTDVATGKPLFPHDGHFGLVHDLWFSADGKSLTSVGRDRRMLRWDVATRREAELPLATPTGGLLVTARTPDGRTLAAVDWMGGPVRVLDPTTGKELITLERPGDGRYALAFAPDGKLLASGGKDTVITLWEVAGRKAVRRLEGHKEAIAHLAFSPDGRVLASSTWPEGPRLERGVQLWDAVTGAKLRHLDDPCEFPNFVFSPDGKLLAVAESYRDRGVRVYEAATGKERFRGLPDLSAAGLAFSPDGRLLAVSGADGDNRIVLWETATWQKVRTVRGHYGGSICLAFSPDHRTLASGGSDSTILMWDLTGASDAGWPKPPPPEECWADLRGDPATANRAVWSLAQAPRAAVPLLAEKLRPAPAPDPAAVARLVSDLDAPDFRTRSRAEAGLAKLGDPGAPALRKHLQKSPSPEVRRTLTRLLASWESGPEWLRSTRALQALEYAGTPDARKALRALADGPQGLRVSDEARAALRRLEK